MIVDLLQRAGSGVAYDGLEAPLLGFTGEQLPGTA
jgi:hypothetical protein